MAKINIYFQDLSEEAQQEVVKELEEKLSGEIHDAWDLNPQIDFETTKQEMIDDYINTHNFANEFII